jgi:hypothetical protein
VRVNEIGTHEVMRTLSVVPEKKSSNRKIKVIYSGFEQSLGIISLFCAILPRYNTYCSSSGSRVSSDIRKMGGGSIGLRSKRFTISEKVFPDNGK